MYARLEEDHGLARHAMAIYDRATKAVLPVEQFEVYTALKNLYILVSHARRTFVCLWDPSWTCGAKDKENVAPRGKFRLMSADLNSQVINNISLSTLQPLFWYKIVVSRLHTINVAMLQWHRPLGITRLVFMPQWHRRLVIKGLVIVVNASVYT